ncbi:MAG: tRNA uridine-5-carboxymethylaminomethyl(34) synthesis GTPase MnmE [Desulfopila sp.]
MSEDRYHDTIAAISTPPGSGGIGVIRISGEKALAVLQRLFRPAVGDCVYASHHLNYGHIVDPVSGRIVDEVLAVYMRAPRSYTREDVAEIHCHGSFLVLEEVLELILAAGAILAAPGEFTKRAFLNGRIDLTRAEAVIDILSARTRKGVDLAEAQLAGALYQRIDTIRQSLVQMRAVMEVALDYPDEDLEIVDHNHLQDQLQVEVIAPLGQLLANVDQGRIYREGIAIVIAGLPNVGKSSLMNTLLDQERALVTEIPGTTRDTIEEYLDIHGMPVRLIDTAGIRETVEKVEELGIRRARSQINEADLVLFMLDGDKGITKADLSLHAALRHKPMLVVVNKADLAAVGADFAAPLQTEAPVVAISAVTRQGIDRLKDTIFSQVARGAEQWEEQGCAPNIRHKQALLQARDASLRARDAFAAGATIDLVAIDLQECLAQLGAIVGETTTEDVLDVIFERFCLGK